MKKYRKTKKVTVEGLQLKKRVGRNRRRAKFVGFILILAIIALAAAVAVLPMLTGAVVSLKAMDFWKAFQKMDLKSAEGLTKVVVAGLYGLMLLGLVINVLRALGKVKKLHKKKGTKADGFNHSAYAMHDLGKIFSGSFAVIILTYFLISLICKDAKPEGMWLLIVLGAGVVIHLFTGVVGGKISYFDIDENQVVEQRREVGRFAPFFRNVLQLGAVFGIMYFLLQANAKATILTQLIDPNVASVFSGMALGNLIVTVAQIVAVLCVFVLVKHATAITEYNIDGAHGSGMKNFRVFSFFVFLAAGAVVACKYLLLKEKELDMNLLIVAGIAFAMFIIELIMRKCPKLPEEKGKKEKKEKNPDDHIALDSMSAAKLEEKGRKSKKEKKGQEQVQAPATVPQQPVYPVYPPMQAAPQQMPPQGYAPQGYPMPQPQPYPYMYYPQPYYPVAMPPVQQVQPQVQQQPAVHILPVMNFKPEEPVAAVATPAAVVEPAPVKVEQEPVEEEEAPEEKSFDGPRVEVDCPHCGKRLRVNSGAKYHRCPVCDRVFALRGKTEK